MHNGRARMHATFNLSLECRICRGERHGLIKWKKKHAANEVTNLNNNQLSKDSKIRDKTNSKKLTIVIIQVN